MSKHESKSEIRRRIKTKTKNSEAYSTFFFADFPFLWFLLSIFFNYYYVRWWEITSQMGFFNVFFIFLFRWLANNKLVYRRRVKITALFLQMDPYLWEQERERWREWPSPSTGRLCTGWTHDIDQKREKRQISSSFPLSNSPFTGIIWFTWFCFEWLNAAFVFFTHITTSKWLQG